MSHLNHYSSDVLKNCKRTLLKKAVAELGLGIDFESKVIRNTWVTDNVDAVLLKDNEPIAVGFKFKKEGKDTTCEISGDFFGTGIDKGTFINNLYQTYKKHDVIYQCEQQGWQVDRNSIYIDKKTEEVVIEASRITA
jgi:hypothetical protein